MGFFFTHLQNKGSVRAEDFSTIFLIYWSREAEKNWSLKQEITHCGGFDVQWCVLACVIYIDKPCKQSSFQIEGGGVNSATPATPAAIHLTVSGGRGSTRDSGACQSQGRQLTLLNPNLEQKAINNGRLKSSARRSRSRRLARVSKCHTHGNICRGPDLRTRTKTQQRSWEFFSVWDFRWIKQTCAARA